MHNRLMACVATVFFHQAVEEKTFVNALLSFQHACNVVFVIKSEKEKVPHAEPDAEARNMFVEGRGTMLLVLFTSSRQAVVERKKGG